MVNQAIETIKKKSIQIYFALLFVLLLYIYLPSFCHPPRSDHWSALYFFYRIDMLLGPHKWKYILTYDPLIKTTFRPLSFLLPYFEHVIFGSNFIFNQIITFALYFLSILLLYKLAVSFCKSKILTAFFLGVFSFLFSHFDLVCWSFQSHIILSFCLFLAGFISYINYLNSNRRKFLVFVIIFFLSGMLSYEAFLLWPFAVIILSYAKEPNKSTEAKRVKLPLAYTLVIATVYALYISLFFLNRVLTEGYSESQIPLSPLFSIDAVISNFFLVPFNLLYNNFLINLIPQIAFPLNTADSNLNMGGFIANLQLDTSKIIFSSGTLVIIIFLFLVIYLLRKKKIKIVKELMFFSFLLFSELFILFYFKSVVNDNIYNLTQFRFQYVPNAIFVLTVLFLIDRLVKPSMRNSIIIGTILSLVIISNVYAVKEGMDILNKQLAPLERLLGNIKRGIKTGKINEENKIFLDRRIVDSLPILCWNKVMGIRCMRGSYQWVFSKKEIGYFSSLKDEKWIINNDNLSIESK